MEKAATGHHAMKKRHLLLILIGFIPLAILILPFLLALVLSAYDLAWGWLFRLMH